jgi:hypothetical protein
MTTTSTWQKFKLPVIILVAFLLAALWVLAGRLVFGVFGWMVLVLLLTIVPVIVIYAIVLTIVVALRQRTYRYRKWGPFMTSVVVTLAALFVVGIFMPDGGDSKDSAASALSVLLGDRTNSGIIGASGVIVGWAIFVATIAAIVAFIFAFAERPKKAPRVQA